MQKRAGRYLRFSDDSQNVSSLDRQDTLTFDWCKSNNVFIIETFKDDGYSARTFDRPDVQKLFDFIKRNHKSIDYLVVAELSRFSRDLGGAVTMVKTIQMKYNVRIVSCTWNQIYDVTEANSLLMLGIEFSLANVDNLTRISNTNGGIYTAKTGIKGERTGNEVGRYIGSTPPFGYKKVAKEGEKYKVLEVDEATANTVRYIFDNYRHGIPQKLLLAEARKVGYKAHGKSVIQKILTNPIYTGYQNVKPWKNNPGGLFKGNWEPIIDNITWHQVQELIKGRKSKGFSADERFPLRGVLRCWCGLPLTAAPSKSRSGKYFDYYKCNHSKHNNFSAIQAHATLEEILGYLSLPDFIVDAVRDEALIKLEARNKENKELLKRVVSELRAVENKLQQLEEKFITNQIHPDTYSRWNNQYIQDIAYKRSQVDLLNKDENETYLLLEKYLPDLCDMRSLYNEGSLIQKQRLLNTVFDNKLYIRDKHYRTTYLMDIFRHNELILNKKKLLFFDKKGNFLQSPPVG